MIVCVCNNISEQKIRSAVDTGVTSMAQLREQFDLGKCCGKCHSSAKDVLRDCMHKKQGLYLVEPPVYQSAKVIPLHLAASA